MGIFHIYVICKKRVIDLSPSSVVMPPCVTCVPAGGVIFAVNGPRVGEDSPATQGFTLDINTGALLNTWNTPGEVSL